MGEFSAVINSADQEKPFREFFLTRFGISSFGCEHSNGVWVRGSIQSRQCLDFENICSNHPSLIKGTESGLAPRNNSINLDGVAALLSLDVVHLSLPLPHLLLRHVHCAVQGQLQSDPIPCRLPSQDPWQCSIGDYSRNGLRLSVVGRLHELFFTKSKNLPNLIRKRSLTQTKSKFWKIGV